MTDVYIRVKHAKVAKTYERREFDGMAGPADYIVDLDEDGHVVGIEVMSAVSIEINGKEVL